MKFKIKFENIFVVLSVLFMFGCCCFYGYRLVKYYKVFNPKNEAGEKVEIFSATVRKNNPVITEGDGLYIYNGDFLFKGDAVNNYVLYADKTWRIIQVNRSGSVKLVLDESLAEINFDALEDVNYDKSYLYNYIKDENNLKVNKNQLEQMKVCLDVIDDASEITCENSINEYVSILSISDYINSFNMDTNKSYINNSHNTWLQHKNSEDLVWSIINDKLTQADVDNEFAVRPVIVLQSTVVSETGDGTKNNPYVVKDGE